MNTIDFNQTGGFPIETEIFADMQNNINMLNNFSGLVGNYSIVKGCNVVGSNVSDGSVFVDGELLEFRGGALQANVIIREETIDIEFEDGQFKPVYRKRWATFGTGVGSTPWANFKRVYPLTSALFVDEIRMFAGDLESLPLGWHFCDGTNNTEDLRGRFIVGKNPNDIEYDTVGKIGGLKEVSLTLGQLPSHRFPFKVREDGYGSGDGPSLVKNSAGNDEGQRTFYTESQGNNEKHENRPPYYALAFIQFKGI